MNDPNVMDFRRKVLASLLNLRQDIDTLKKELSQYPWDTDEELVILKRMHLLNILSKYSLGLLTKNDIAEWANLVGHREDVGYEKGFERTVADIVVELANPKINAELNAQKVEDYFKVLGG